MVEETKTGQKFFTDLCAANFWYIQIPTRNCKNLTAEVRQVEILSQCKSDITKLFIIMPSQLKRRYSFFAMYYLCLLSAMLGLNKQTVRNFQILDM